MGPASSRARWCAGTAPTGPPPTSTVAGSPPPSPPPQCHVRIAPQSMLQETTWAKIFWMLVRSADNFEATKRHGFEVQGVKSRHRKKAERMQPGDRVAYYLTGIQAFGGTAT